MGSTQAKPNNTAIVMCLDDQFLLPGLTTIESIARNGGTLENCTLVILTTGLTDTSINALEASSFRAEIPLSVRTIENIDDLGSIANWAISTCIRLYAGDICNDFDRVLYLDADLLILAPLFPLINYELDDKIAAAVINHPPLSIMQIAIPRSRRGSINPAASYFNAGVLLFDVYRWTHESIGQQCRSFIRKFPTTRLLDQDALNISLANNWHSLEKEWNVPAGPLDEAPMMQGLSNINPSLAKDISQWHQVQKNPKILHFTGQPKPWSADYPWQDLKNMYSDYIISATHLIWPSDRSDTVSDTLGEQKAHGFKRN